MFRKLIQQVMRASTIAAAVWLVGCANSSVRDDSALQREAMAGTQNPVPAPLPLSNDINASNGDLATKPDISKGTGSFIHPTGLSTPRTAAAGDGAVTFNFENQPVQAVVKAILGDLLKQNYTIVPGVQGNISFSTSEPVDSSQALPILETLLSWTHNALIKRAGGYVVLPEKEAVAGNMVPSLGANAPTGGLQSRLYPLRYISATEMQKLIKPFARQDAVLLADPARNLIVMSGTPEELANYSSMVKTFDVDWLRGMSIGVFNLQYAKVDELMPKLDGLFGEHGDTPLAGTLRFIPIERTNALVVISTQPQYLQEVGDWISKIDAGGGNEPQLFVYDVRNLKASDLAKYLAQIYASGSGSGNGSDTNGKVGPGLSGSTLGSGDNSNSGKSDGSTAGSFGSSTSGAGGLSGGLGSSGSTSGLGSSSGIGSTSGVGGSGSSSGFGGLGSSSNGSSGGLNNNGNNANADQEYNSSDGSIHIGSVDSNNQLLVRARPSQWKEMQEAIKKLDNVPLQVQIETRILEVTLTNDFAFGVQYYLDGLTGGTTNSDGSITPGQTYRHRSIGAGGGGTVPTSTDTLFYSFINSKTQIAISAMETSANTKTLSAPSMVVMNNQEAHIQVGNQIPVNQTSLIGLGGTGTTDTTASSVTYLPTGVILDVQPRVNPGGLVYLNVHQQVSATQGDANAQGNYTIAQRDVATQVAVQSGQTVLLGGLITQDNEVANTGVPFLSDIPVLGRLFGTTSKSRTRTELVVLITPKVIRNSEDAKQVTNDYQSKFESLSPLHASGAPTTPMALALSTALQSSAPGSITPLPVSSNSPSASTISPDAPAPSWPEQLQQHAEDALRQSDYATAQDLAMQSWRQGSHRGSLCERNWQVIVQARQHNSRLGNIDAARKQQSVCLSSTSP